MCGSDSANVAKIRSTFSATLTVFVAAFPPMLTWSSCSLEEGIESTEQGVHNCLFLLTIAVVAGVTT